jgi:aspartyl-tRNA(Asn)/glutamyl-tRNA(Gln) amidotransferase subunit A
MTGQATATYQLTAAEAARLIHTGELSPVVLVQTLLQRAESVGAGLRAWVRLDGERALSAARGAEATLRAGDALGALHGVPFGAKDIFDSAGLTTAAGFGPYANRVPTRDADAIDLLKQHGAILVGKLATTQFAYADPSPTRNPWAPDRTPGGSSSGSAAAVAARLIPFALGSQTAGSVLRPAAFNGVVGFKPSYGRISKRGVLPLAWSLDHVGVLARSVEDCALFLAAVSTEAPPRVDPGGLVAPRLGLVREALAYASPRASEHTRAVAARLAQAGAVVEEVSFGAPLELILAVHHVIMQTETAAVHWQLLEQYPGAHQPRLRAYVEVGRLLPGVTYVHASRLRQRIALAMQQSLQRVDAFLLPTASDVAPGRETTGDPALQAPFSLVGFPSLSLPTGVAEPEGLPLAVQLAGPRDHDERLLSVASWCEAQLPAMPAPDGFA